MSLDDSLTDYVTWLDDELLPTPEQRTSFVEYVAHSHSWYKHLPLYPPGTPFYFFLNKYAGWAREHGTPSVGERKERGSHYSQVSTAVYRSAFACLDYALEGDRVALVEERRTVPPGDWRDRAPGVGRLSYGLPAEVLTAGASLVTGAIHVCSSSMSWLWLDETRRPACVQWPEESGGMETLERIFEHCVETRRPGFDQTESWMNLGKTKPYPSAADQIETDAVLYQLLLPERLRQERGMIAAMNRVCESVQRQRHP
jgi:hypothetical protein